MNENTRAAARMFPEGGSTSSFGRPLVPTTAMKYYAGGEYDRELNEYEMDQMVESFINSISSIPDLGHMEGGSRKKQHGGGPKLREACERVKAKFKANAAQIVDNVDGAAAEVIESNFGDVRSAMTSVAVVTAASTVVFGTSQAPFISSALQTLCSTLPSALYNSAANLISASLTAAQITALGVTGIAGLMTFAIMIIALYKVNTMAMGTLRSAGTSAVSFIQSLVNWNPRGVSVPTVTTDQVKEAISRVTSSAPTPIYKVGIMVITGPNAANLVRSMTKRPAGANVSDLVMKQQGGIERKRNKRKQSKNKRETYSKNKKNKKRNTMKKH
jgi:hypothetical protein